LRYDVTSVFRNVVLDTCTYTRVQIRSLEVLVLSGVMKKWGEINCDFRHSARFLDPNLVLLEKKFCRQGNSISTS